MPDFRLDVMFVDGIRGEVDMQSFLTDSKTTGTVFELLRNPAVFAQAQVVMGAAQWANGADLALDAMYDTIKAHGRWVVE